MATARFADPSDVGAISEIEDIELLMGRYQTRVFRFIYASVRDMDVAQSLTQDCFWKAYQRRQSFRGDCSIHTWLFRIAINLVRDHARNKTFQFWRKASFVSGHEMANRPEFGVSLEHQSVHAEQVKAIFKATETLSERQRTAFILRFIEDMDICEIAEWALQVLAGSRIRTDYSSYA